MWSLTIPTFCMKAYTLVGTGVNLSDPGEDVWGSCPVGLVATDGTQTNGG